MSSTKVEQGTQEWRDARIGKITGSIIGSVMGCSPFTSRKAALRRMVDESLGNLEDFDNEPMRWGRDHETIAATEYEFLYAGIKVVEETGFWEKDDLGASPDRLVGDDGLVEIKCPYGIRHNKSPEFKSILDKDMRHYWHQIQAQMFVTGRKWCHFFQWTPHGNLLETVEADEKWFEDCKPHFDQFMAEYHDLLHKASQGGPEDRVGLSARWAAAVEAYQLAARVEAAAASDRKQAEETMIELMKANEIEQCEGAGMKGQLVKRKGSVDYKKLAKEQLTDPVVSEIEDQYRRNGSEYWSFKMEAEQ